MTTRATVRLILVFVAAYDKWQALYQKCLQGATAEMEAERDNAYGAMEEARKKFLQ